MSHDSAASLFYSENPLKPPVVMTKGLPPPITRDTVVRTFIENKGDLGEFTAAMAYEPETAGKRLAAREADVKSTVAEALSKIQ